MNIEEAQVVKLGVVGKRKRIQLTNIKPECKQWLLRLRNGRVYLEPADDVLAFSRQEDRIHLNKAADILGLKEGDKYVIMENEGKLILLKLNVPLEEELWRKSMRRKRGLRRRR